ncbi:MAG: tRNA (N6-threonylcarbamoyladenosine(37)-N6)-methyltransferase TrmO [Mobilitalea sp.]
MSNVDNSKKKQWVKATKNINPNDHQLDHHKLKIIARIRTEFPEKFGIPRQSGIVDSVKATIVFEPEYRNIDSLRGLEGFTHIWLIWGFFHTKADTWSPMVKPPRLGGNKRMGVFATRSPFRPNPLGLSSVKLEGIEINPELGPVLRVSGADLMDQTPIYDIKPYLAYTDSHPEATGGFAESLKDYELKVIFPEELKNQIPEKHHEALYGIMAHDPRPSYHDDPERIYGFAYAGFNIRFTVADLLLTVCEVTKI